MFTFTKKSIALLLIGVILFGLGAALWIIVPESATNVSDEAPWGVYIAAFLLFEALCVGSLFFGAWLKNRFMVGLGVAAACATGLSIGFDLGSPLVMWRLLLTPNLSAPMILDVWFLGASVIFGLVLWFALSTGREKLADVSAVLTQIAAVLLPLGTAWLFTTLPGMPGWESSLEIAMFIVQAAAVGLAIACVQKKDWSKAAAGALLVLLAVNVAEAGHTFYSGEELSSEVMLFGKFAPIYWLALIIGVVVPMVLLIKGGSQKAAMILTVAGVAVSKYLYIVKGNLFPYHNWHGKVTLPFEAAVDGHTMLVYTPAPVEWVICLGAAGLMLAVAAVLCTCKTEKATA